MASYVSIHTPTQGVTSCGLCYCILKCFNPHTHAGCDTIKILRKWILRVSIHTPTQGVTPSTIEDEYPYGVSIHTPTQGVTLFKMENSESCNCFNPHTHAGCDCRRDAGFMQQQGFNPHTHAGCDPGAGSSGVYPVCFNPHTHAGCDSAV